MSDVLLLGVWLFGTVGLGLGVSAVIGGRTLFERRIEWFGLAWVLGISVGSQLLFLWSLVGGPLGAGTSRMLTGAGIAAGLAAVWVSLRIRSRGPSGKPGSSSRIAVAGMAAISGLFLFALVQALLTPQKFWDERAYYGLKAIVLFEDRTIYSPDLAEADFVQGHPRYPLLISLAEQHIYATLGHVDDRLSKVLFPSLYFGMVLVFAGVLSRHVGRDTAWLGAILLATVPVLMPDDYGFLCGQADAPVACLEGLALLYLWDWLSQREAGSLPEWSSLWYAGVCSSLAAFTKDEGISHSLVHTIGFSLAAGIGSVRYRGRVPCSWFSSVQTVFALVLVEIVLIAPWLVHRQSLPMTGEMDYSGRFTVEALGKGLSTLSWSVPHLLQRMFLEAPRWGLQWWLIVVGLVLRPGDTLRPPQLFLGLTLAGCLMALLVAGMLAPVALEEHIDGSSHRYLMQLTPAAVLLGFSLLTQGGDRLPAAGQGRQ